jgi:hypothetical protein
MLDGLDHAVACAAYTLEIGAQPLNGLVVAILDPDPAPENVR